MGVALHVSLEQLSLTPDCQESVNRQQNDNLQQNDGDQFGSKFHGHSNR
jgi:hypothetical protein